MSAFEMASVPKLSYQRLRNEGWYEEGEEHKQDAIVIKRTRSWSKNFRRVHLRRRLKIRIPGLRRFLRKKAKLFSAVRLSYNKVIRRFVEGVVVHLPTDKFEDEGESASKLKDPPRKDPYGGARHPLGNPNPLVRPYRLETNCGACDEIVYGDNSMDLSYNPRRVH
ncbi:hypothetical protein IFM89_033824 [Coptis chinensis]|uniref:Uncharacterized protein n=1 Tax=Coptis chinensis TaxID=261450 RepID=A0A835LTT3_9MAGN|nr:hypothetical protein IFM89_033824 [Coptis chinensis]